MSNKNLFQEAIADAKAVREAALANAKAALEEVMTPRLQTMIAARLEENYDDMEQDTYEEGMYPDKTSDDTQNYYHGIGASLEEKKRKKLDKTDHFYSEKPGGIEPGISNPFGKGKRNEPGTEKGRPYMEEDLDEELDLSAILAELEAESQLEEAKKKKEDEETDEETETKETSEEETDEEAEPVELKDMTVEEATDAIMDKLEARIKDIVHNEIEAEENETPGMEAEEPEHGGMGMEPNMADNEEDININELLAELDEMYGKEEEDEVIQYETKKMKVKKDEEMKEALSVINTLRRELNEVNLLNAKLLYVNKIFKAKSLSESQKLQVITSFDKATTIKEAKIVFESLNTALTAPKKQIKESLGFASRAAGIAPRKQQIVESNDAITRMQKLANIIK
jgi:hypothetical protein